MTPYGSLQARKLQLEAHRLIRVEKLDRDGDELDFGNAFELERDAHFTQPFDLRRLFSLRQQLAFGPLVFGQQWAIDLTNATSLNCGEVVVAAEEPEIVDLEDEAEDVVRGLNNGQG